jgi:hypothetical protein
LLVFLTWSAEMAGIGFKDSSQPGRPRKKLPAAALSSFLPQLSSSEVITGPAYSSSKGFYQRSCGHKKHLCYAACDTISRESGTLQCRICKKDGSSKPSQLECELYDILNKHKGIRTFAVEAHAVHGTEQWEGRELDLGRQRWDVMLVQPAGVLLAVQGDQHHSKLDSRANSSSQTEVDLAATMARDMALADAAVQQGFQVVWLLPGKAAGGTRRWRTVINQALEQAKLGGKGKLHMA